MEGIERGKGMKGEQWYNTDPTLQDWRTVLGEDIGDKQHEKFWSMVGATSPRSKVDANMGNASYYYARDAQGLPIEKAPKGSGYGHLAGNLHHKNVETVLGPGYDIMKNPKPPSFDANLQGNFRPGTMDAHALKGVVMHSDDPRWLATSYDVKAGSPAANRFLGMEGIGARPNEAKGLVTINPRQAVQGGRLSMEEAKQSPAWWEAQPAPNEYGAFENYYGGLGRDAGIDHGRGLIAPLLYQDLIRGNSPVSGGPGGAAFSGLRPPDAATAEEQPIDPRQLFMLQHPYDGA
jgi:hypothetical protein